MVDLCLRLVKNHQNGQSDKKNPKDKGNKHGEELDIRMFWTGSHD
jgi:hypothetical protein